MTDLWLPKIKELFVPIKHIVRIAGYYKVEAVDCITGRRRVCADWFPNLILTNGADLLGNGAPLSYCSVGTGNTAPALTDTALVARVATTSTQNSNNNGVSGSAPWYGTRTIQYNFAAGTATGNLAEVGVGSASNGTNLFSRALILDGLGSPTTITVLSSEALYVTYQLNQYSPSTDVTGNVNIAGTNYSYTLRAANANSASYWGLQNGDAGGINLAQTSVTNGAIGTVTGSPSGTSAVCSSVNNNAYSNGSYTLSGTASWDITHGNVSGGVTAAFVVFGSGSGTRGAFQIGFGTAIPKDASHVLTLSFSTTWAINTP